VRELGPKTFETTQWSLVVAARDRSSVVARRAFDGLASKYWRPLYAYVRRRGHTAEEAEDLVQGFFLRFIAKDYLHSVSADKGRFRSFLLACIQHFLADEFDRQQALKRGGGQKAVAIDVDLIEATLLPRVSSIPSPEAAYDHAWAVSVLDESLELLESEYEEQAKGRLFGLLKPRLVGESEPTYSDVAEVEGLSEAAVRKAAQRLRRRYKQLVRKTIGNSVSSEDVVEDEMRLLFEALE
jgi:RNA polymerase sigma-70 factor (ECF subfamily)